MRIGFCIAFAAAGCAGQALAYPGASEVMEALSVCAGQPVVYDAACQATDEPTEFTCDYRLRDGSEEGVPHQTVIAQDGDKFVLIDIPSHCQTL